MQSREQYKIRILRTNSIIIRDLIENDNSLASNLNAIVKFINKFKPVTSDDINTIIQYLDGELNL